MSKKEMKKKGTPKPSGQPGLPPQKPQATPQPEGQPGLPPQKPAKKEQPQPAGQPGLPPQQRQSTGGQSQKRISERQLIMQSHRDENRQRRRRNLINIAIGLAALVVLVITFVLGSRQPSITALVKEEGAVNCFPAGTSPDCQISAVLYDGTNINFANRNSVPNTDYSSLFTIPWSEGKPASDTISYLTATPFLQALDLESLAISTDGNYIFAMTGFDRVKSDSSEWNYYNMLLAWPREDPTKVQIVSATTTPEGVKSSVSMRNKFSQMLDNAPYFEIHGLTALPNNYLLFGISHIGQSAEDNSPVFKIIVVPYSINKDSGEIELSDKYQIKYSLDPTKTNPEIAHKLSLSSLEYDTYKNRLLILASFDEGAANTGAYLWTLTIDDLNNTRLPQLVTNADGTPFTFASKAEGLTTIGNTTYLVATNASAREAQQATYQIITLSR